MEPAGRCGKVFGVGSTDAADVRASLDDPERFAAIFERHHRVVWRYLARLGGRELADELAGDVFVTAFARRATFDPDLGAVRSWLYGIATNLWRTRARSDARGAAALRRAQQAASAAPGDQEAVPATVDAEQTYRHVLDAMALLGDADRAVLVLYAWEELSYGEIAMALGVPVGTVRSRLARARQRLRELTEPDGELMGDGDHDHRRAR